MEEEEEEEELLTGDQRLAGMRPSSRNAWREIKGKMRVRPLGVPDRWDFSKGAKPPS